MALQGKEKALSLSVEQRCKNLGITMDRNLVMANNIEWFLSRLKLIQG